jgi:hypothetical protein
MISFKHFWPMGNSSKNHKYKELEAWLAAMPGSMHARAMIDMADSANG